MEAWNERKSEVSKLFDSSSTSRSSKRKKDPNAPKKWKTGYILFCVDQREKLKNDDTSLSATEITSKLGSMWKSLSEKDKSKYEALSLKDKSRYENDMTSYTPSGEFSVEKSSSRSKKERTGPKRPLSSYMYYCQDNRETVKSQNPNMNGKEITTELGKRWKNLTEEQKVPYEAKATADKARFASEKSSETQQTPKSKQTPSESKSKQEAPRQDAPKQQGSKQEASRQDASKQDASKQTKTTAPVQVAPSVTHSKQTTESDSKSKSKQTSSKQPPAKPVQDSKSKSSCSKKTPGFDCFCEEQTEDIQSENPDWSSRKINAELSKRWQELSSDDREAYEMEAVEQSEEDEVLEDEL
jgi:structure-specific recognition protein 1